MSYIIYHIWSSNEELQAGQREAERRRAREVAALRAQIARDAEDARRRQDEHFALMQRLVGAQAKVSIFLFIIKTLTQS